MSSATKTAAVSTYVALLRGINVGGRHSLPMKDLARFFDEAKCGSVRTYIQSGNVVFSPPRGALAKLGKCIEGKIEQRFGFSSTVILRSADEMVQVLRSNPFLKDGMPEKTLYVYFLADTPTAEAIQLLDPSRSVPDAYRVVGREVYLYMPNGMGRTKLTSSYLDSRLSTVGTARNWATVCKLFEMAHA